MSTDQSPNYGTVFGARPGQTAFYMPPETFLVNRDDREKLWRSVQQDVSDFHKRFLPTVRQYVLLEDLAIPVSVAKANPQHGEGGGMVYYISDYKKFLQPIVERQNLDRIEPPSMDLREVIDFEMNMGNKLDYVDHLPNGRLMGIYLIQPLHFKQMDGKLAFPPTVEHFYCQENRFFAPEAGFLCSKTRQFVTGPMPHQYPPATPVPPLGNRN
ncbi:MAG: hypothetical protein AB7O99_02215 [Dongiaceae bacterium]